jgi:alpha-beta hydrolase superfamily lysophospholipase
MAPRGERLATWTFGEGPAILAFHGWGGHAGRLSRFFPALVRAGFSVVAVDAPGHGASSGSRVSLPDFVAAVEAVTEANGPVAGAIGHSAGAAAIALAIRRGAPIGRAVLLAPPAEPEHYAAKFAVHFGIPAQVREGMKRRLGQRYGMEWSDLRLTGATEKPSDLLVFHDRRDQSVPWRDGAALVSASPGARLITTEGLGHHKILRDRRVVAETARFFASGAIPRMPVPIPMDAVPVAALSGAAS